MAAQTDNNVDGNGVIVIGIDFGTTYTGVAYSYAKPGDQGSSDMKPVAITLWPAPDSDDATPDSPKVPSCISYAPGGTISWGHQAAEDQKAITWSKLLLLDDADMEPHLRKCQHIRQARDRVQKTSKSAIAVIADFLAKVWSHTLEVITRAFGQDFVTTHRFHLVVTVPAIWQDNTNQRMERAVEEAGLLAKRPGCDDTSLTIVSEPEAAALAAIDGYRKYDVLEPGQTLVIVDLGGGTADLISFRVRSIKPKLVLEEVVEGKGGLCGASFLDQAFLECLDKKIERKKRSDRTLKSWKQLDEEDKNRIMDINWERGIKRYYSHGKRERHIKLGAQGNRRPTVLLEKNDLETIFNSVYKEISALVEGQVRAIETKTRKLPKFIVLTGGFGRCEYIYHELHKEYADRIEILFENTDRPWTAVARGAVLSGIGYITNEEQVQSHISRYSYAWLKWEDFDHHIHDFDDHDIHELTGRPMARDQMEWFILRGESVKAQSSRVYEYDMHFDIDDTGFVTFSEPLYRSTLRAPPKRLAENEPEHNSNGVSELSDFRKYVIIDMKTPVPVEQLPKRGGSEFPHRVLEYRVEVNVSGASLIIKAIAHGKEIGKKVISGYYD